MNTKTKPWLSHYDEGVPAEIDISNITLNELFKQSVSLNGELTCIIYQDETWTYKQVDDLSDRVARYLISKGIRKGDRVGIMEPNTPVFVIAYYGILKAGGVVMAINPAYRPEEVRNLVIEAGVKIIILPTEMVPAVKTFQDQTAIQSFVVVGEKLRPISSDDIYWDELLARWDQGDPVTQKVTPDDPAVFQYSGGTTGIPKCAIGRHRNLVANVTQFQQWLVNTEAQKETVLVAIPMYHVYGMVLGMNLTVKMGARMVLIPNPRELDSLLEAIQNYQVTIFPGVPTIYAAINQYPPVIAGEYDLSSIKACISGSATLPAKVKQGFEDLTKGHLVEGYGLSEAPTATHCNPILGLNKAGSIGLPLPNVDCKVVDLKTGLSEVPVGDIGELIVRGPQVMASYHQNPLETAIALRDGWLYTGDVVWMDDDGYFYLVDRKKDVIKVGGFQVWPNEVEQVILRHPKVKEVAVAGVMHETKGEVAKAWVVLKDNSHISAEDIQSFCKQYLVSYKIPKIIFFRGSLPRTRVGKILRRVLIAEDA
jgi:long-chain acyl-CoA synthetase